MSEEASHTTLSVRVLPRSSRDDIVGTEGGVYKIKLTAPAVEGKANKSLLSLLAKRLDLPKTRIQLIAGERSRSKSIRIHGLAPEQVEARLKGG